MKKVILILSIVILAIFLSTAYYIYILTPQNKAKEQKERTEYIFSKRQECQLVGQSYYQQQREEEIQNFPNIFLDTYAYNEKLNTCLISYGKTNASQTTRIFYVVDVFSSKELLQYRILKLSDGKLNLALGYDTGSYIMTCDDSGTMFPKKCSDGLESSIKAAYEQRKTELLSQ